MKEAIKINFLKSAVYGYSLMEEITEKNKTEEWAKQIQSIKRYFERIKTKGLTSKDISFTVKKAVSYSKRTLETTWS